ncbi:MAG: hypothetical protein H7320_18985 [Ferruginibacter sp.]|nr:hypothetical protein [Ferruginibacter sp.]
METFIVCRRVANRLQHILF